VSASTSHAATPHAGGPATSHGPERPEVVLLARGLHRFYRAGEEEVAALREVSLDLCAGELLAVTGRSGSGKSTLLGLLAGLDDPDGGHVTVAGERLSHRPAGVQARLRATHIGVLTQVSGLVDHLDVAGNVELAARLRAGSRRDRRTGKTRTRAGRSAALDLLAEVGLADRATAVPAQLSGGETARAGLAVALAGAPTLLLADEPTTEVSREEEVLLLAALRRLVPPSGGVVVVTHSAAVAGAADRVIHLADGRVAA